MIFADEPGWQRLGHRALDVAEKAIAAYQERTDADAHAEVERMASAKTAMDSLERLLKIFKGHRDGEGG
jgi:hypothetical protein